MLSRKVSRLLVPVLGTMANLAIDLAVEKAGFEPGRASVVRAVSKAAVSVTLAIALAAGAEDDSPAAPAPPAEETAPAVP